MAIPPSRQLIGAHHVLALWQNQHCAHQWLAWRQFDPELGQDCAASGSGCDRGGKPSCCDSRTPHITTVGSTNTMYGTMYDVIALSSRPNSRRQCILQKGESQQTATAQLPPVPPTHTAHGMGAGRH